MKFLFLSVMILLMTTVNSYAQSWRQTRDYAMQLREQGRVIEAYTMAAKFPASNNLDIVDRDFVAGFIALRVLGRADIAVTHFQNMALTSGKLTAREDAANHRSMAGYWLGRALEAKGAKKEADLLYAASAGYRDTYYGLMSASVLGLRDTSQSILQSSAKYPKPDLFWHDPRVQKELVLAVIKTESNFRQSAISHAGAMGSMQIMPGTVSAISRKSGVSLDHRMVRDNKAYNIAVGSKYFADLMARYSNHIVLATGAYNAGEGSVDNWLRRFGDPRHGKIDIVDWIELIPFGETRGYVKRISANYVSYLALSAK